MKTWLVVLKYDDNRVFVAEEKDIISADKKAAELMRLHGSENLTIYITEIITAISHKSVSR